MVFYCKCVAMGEGEEEGESGQSFTKFSTFFPLQFFFPSWNHGEILATFFALTKGLKVITCCIGHSLLLGV